MLNDQLDPGDGGGLTVPPPNDNSLTFSDGFTPPSTFTTPVETPKMPDFVNNDASGDFLKNNQTVGSGGYRFTPPPAPEGQTYVDENNNPIGTPPPTYGQAFNSPTDQQDFWGQTFADAQNQQAQIDQQQPTGQGMQQARGVVQQAFFPDQAPTGSEMYGPDPNGLRLAGAGPTAGQVQTLAQQYYGTESPLDPVLGAVSRAINAGGSALNVVNVYADKLIPGPGQNTIGDRFDAYRRQGMGVDEAANAAMEDYGKALQQFAESGNAPIFSRGVAQAARVAGLLQSVTAPAPLPGGMSSPLGGALVAMAVKGGAKKAAAKEVETVFGKLTEEELARMQEELPTASKALTDAVVANDPKAIQAARQALLDLKVPQNIIENSVNAAKTTAVRAAASAARKQNPAITEDEIKGLISETRQKLDQTLSGASTPEVQQAAADVAKAAEAAPKTATEVAAPAAEAAVEKAPTKVAKSTKAFQGMSDQDFVTTFQKLYADAEEAAKAGTDTPAFAAAMKKLEPAVKEAQARGGYSADIKQIRKNMETVAGNERYSKEVLQDGPFGKITPDDAKRLLATQGDGAARSVIESRMQARGISNEKIRDLEMRIFSKKAAEEAATTVAPPVEKVAKAAAPKTAKAAPKAAAAAKAAAQVATEPPVADGMTRLYRGEGKAVEGITDASKQGRWFTEDPSVAAGYGKLHYVDVPTADLAKYGNGMVGTDIVKIAGGTAAKQYILPAALAKGKQAASDAVVNAAKQQAAANAAAVAARRGKTLAQRTGYQPPKAAKPPVPGGAKPPKPPKPPVTQGPTTPPPGGPAFTRGATPGGYGLLENVERAANAISAPKSLMSAGDVSLSLRQFFAFALAHPKRWAEGVTQSLAAYKDPNKAFNTADNMAKQVGDTLEAYGLRRDELEIPTRNSGGLGSSTNFTAQPFLTRGKYNPLRVMQPVLERSEAAAAVMAAHTRGSVFEDQVRNRALSALQSMGVQSTKDKAVEDLAKVMNGGTFMAITQTRQHMAQLGYGQALGKDQVKELARALNHASGRGYTMPDSEAAMAALRKGDVGGAFRANAEQGAARVLNAVANVALFSPQNTVAKVRFGADVLGAAKTVTADLIRHRPVDPVDLEKLRLGAGYAAGVGGILSVASGLGLNVDLDTNSTNFGKIDLGDPSAANGFIAALGSSSGLGVQTYKAADGTNHVFLDPWGGMSQMIREISREAFLIPAALTGGLSDLAGTNLAGKTPGGEAGQFIRDKMSPVLGNSYDVLNNKNTIDNPSLTGNPITSLFLFLNLQDILQASGLDEGGNTTQKQSGSGGSSGGGSRRGKGSYQK